MTIAYDVATATIAAMMAGSEFAIAAFVHPQIGRLNDAAHAHAAVPLARSLGKVMPLWYAVALAFTLGAAFEHRPISSGPGLLIAAAAAIWAAVILFTVTALVPINNRIAKMNPDQPHSGWLQDRARWDRFHRIRVVLLTAALILLLTGLLRCAAAAAL